MSNYDWIIVKRSAYTLIIIAIISLVAGGITYYFHEEYKREYQNAKNYLDSIKTNYEDLINRNNIYVEYAKKFQQLQTKGVIGQENRLTWIEALQKTNQTVKLPSLQYTISPQQEYPLELVGSEFYSVQVKKTDMSINMGLLHEEDMLNILTGLQNKARGHFLIDECSITPSNIPSNIADIDISKPLMNADCNIHWLQVRMMTPDNVAMEQ